MTSEYTEAIRLLSLVLEDNYNLKNTHEVDPKLRDAIEWFLNSLDDVECVIPCTLFHSNICIKCGKTIKEHF